MALPWRSPGELSLGEFQSAGQISVPYSKSLRHTVPHDARPSRPVQSGGGRGRTEHRSAAASRRPAAGARAGSDRGRRGRSRATRPGRAHDRDRESRPLATARSSRPHHGTAVHGSIFGARAGRARQRSRRPRGCRPRLRDRHPPQGTAAAAARGSPQGRPDGSPRTRRHSLPPRRGRRRASAAVLGCVPTAAHAVGAERTPACPG